MSTALVATNPTARIYVQYFDTDNNDLFHKNCNAAFIIVVFYAMT